MGELVSVLCPSPRACPSFSERAVPPDSLLEPLCTSFRKSDYDIAGLVRTMLASRHFYSNHAFRQRLKGPVEYVLGAAQTVYRRYREEEPNYRPLPQVVLVGWLDSMGQQLFAPPNVKGWPGGASWLNTHTLLERDNFAAALAMGTLWTAQSPEPTTKAAATAPSANAIGKSIKPASLTELPEEPPPPKAFDPARFLQDDGGVGRPMPGAENIVRMLLDQYLPGGVRPEVRAKLAAFVAEGQPTGTDLSRRVREAVHAILTMAEYQLA
jgi:hypothetical protein